MKKIRSLVDRKLTERLYTVDDLSKLIYEAMGLSPENHRIWAIRHLRHITILTDDSILATRLRFEQRMLLHYINSHSALIIDAIDIKMTGKRQERETTPYRKYVISDRNVKIIKSIADGIEDEELRESLKSLANQKR